MRKNKNITKCRRYKNRRRILRGGGEKIDDDANQLIASLNGLDPRSIADLLENIKNDPTFRNAIKERSGQFEMLKSTCKYTESLDNFVDEMITSAVKTLRDEPAPPSPSPSPSSPTEPGQTSEEPKQNLTPETMIGLIPQGADLEELINNLMGKYAAARTGPCLSVKGQKAIFYQRPTTQNKIQQKYTLRKKPPPERTISYTANVRRGGSRRKNKKSKRTRRKQRGGFVIEVAIVLGLIVCIIAVAAVAIKHALDARDPTLHTDD